MLLKLFVIIGADSQVRCRKNSVTYEDALELELKGLVKIQTGTRIDTAYICLSEQGNKLFDEMQKFFIQPGNSQQ